MILQYRSKLKAIKSLLLPTLGFLALALVLLTLWWLQQNNLNALNQKLIDLEQDIRNLPPKFNPEYKLRLEKDLLILEKDRINAQNAVYMSVIQSLSGLFFFITAYLTWRNVRATEQKQVTDRFSKAVEQIESDKLAVQLGGIYALERIATDSHEDHSTIIEVLTSFVRAIASDSHPDNVEPVSPCVQAALIVIGRRNVRHDSENRKINLSYINLSQVSLNNASFKGTDFEGSILRSSHLKNADLRKAYFGGASLNKAKLDGAKLDYLNENDDRPIEKVDFSEASLVKAKLVEAKLTGADFSSAQLDKADLRATHLSKANFSKAKLLKANLARADLSHANFHGANLDSANLSKAVLHKTNFLEAKGLSPEQIKEGEDWDTAIYGEDLKKELGLFSKE
jgi:uncharacterized protein YjbI with pentapeptide repeats